MRAPRLTPPDIPFHVLNRAAGRRQIFLHDNDYAQFEATLDEALSKFRVELAAYCVMPNHYHLLVMPREDGELSRFVAWLQATHSKRWHAAHHGTGGGALYQGRYSSFPVDTDRYLETAWRYIERNPVRAGLVARAEDWPWGSAWNRAHAPQRATRMLRNEFLGVPDDWLGRVNEPLSDAEDAAIRACVQRGRPFGSASWEATVAKRLGLERRGRPRGRTRGRAEKVSDSNSERVSDSNSAEPELESDTLSELESDTFTGRGSRRGRSR